MVDYLNNIFSVFKQHYIHFHTFFHPHVFKKTINNITQTPLPNRPLTAQSGRILIEELHWQQLWSWRPKLQLLILDGSKCQWPEVRENKRHIKKNNNKIKNKKKKKRKRKHDLYAEVVELTTSTELHITGYKNHPNKKASQKRNIEYYL